MCMQWGRAACAFQKKPPTNRGRNLVPVEVACRSLAGKKMKRKRLISIALLLVLATVTVKVSGQCPGEWLVVTGIAFIYLQSCADLPVW